MIVEATMCMTGQEEEDRDRGYLNSGYQSIDQLSQGYQGSGYRTREDVEHGYLGSGYQSADRLEHGYLGSGYHSWDGYQRSRGSRFSRRRTKRVYRRFFLM